MDSSKIGVSREGQVENGQGSDGVSIDSFACVLRSSGSTKKIDCFSFSACNQPLLCLASIESLIVTISE